VLSLLDEKQSVAVVKLGKSAFDVLLVHILFTRPSAPWLDAVLSIVFCRHRDWSTVVVICVDIVLLFARH